MEKDDKGMKVVDFKPKQKQEVTEEIQGRLDIVDALRKRVEEGEITEFVATSLGADGNAVIWSNVADIAAGVGLFEIGKHILMTQYAPEHDGFDFTPE
tara:strand:- start:942 stop:1235 length:294 start_codon:yes stop_codon:yes gene_type:complete